MSLKKKLEPFLRKVPLMGPFALSRPKSYLRQSGWFRSFARFEPVDQHGTPIPWFSYSAIEFLSERLQKDMSVFEFGSGNSTIWLAQRTGKVVSCEHDTNWYGRIRGRLPDNVEYLAVPVQREPYCAALQDRSERFAVIVIDGCYRNEIASFCGRYLQANGVVVYDDSHLDHLRAGCDDLLRQGMKEIRFVGIGPMDYIRKQTSVFYRQANCLGI